jgi:hypothetical protein
VLPKKKKKYSKERIGGWENWYPPLAIHPGKRQKVLRKWTEFVDN